MSRSLALPTTSYRAIGGGRVSPVCMWWTLLCALAQPLATPADEASVTDALRQHVEAAEALGRATGSALHALDASAAPCEAGLPQRVRAFAGAWREAAVASVDHAEQLVALDASPTLTPLRSPARRDEQASLVTRARRTAASYRGAHAVAGRTLARHKACAASLTAAQGWPRPDTRASDDPAPLRAVWVLADGWLCAPEPPALHVSPGPALIGELACLAPTDDCHCALAPVHAGAVLSPQGTRGIGEGRTELGAGG